MSKLTSRSPSPARGFSLSTVRAEVYASGFRWSPGGRQAVRPVCSLPLMRPFRHWTAPPVPAPAAGVRHSRTSTAALPPGGIPARMRRDSRSSSVRRSPAESSATAPRNTAPWGRDTAGPRRYGPRPGARSSTGRHAAAPRGSRPPRAGRQPRPRPDVWEAEDLMDPADRSARRGNLRAEFSAAAPSSFLPTASSIDLLTAGREHEDHAPSRFAVRAGPDLFEVKFIDTDADPPSGALELAGAHDPPAHLCPDPRMTDSWALAFLAVARAGCSASTRFPGALSIRPTTLPVRQVPLGPWPAFST